MKNKAKQLYEKMVDYKRFATLSLAVGVFFYLGVIIPADSKSMMNENIMMIASTAFIAISLLFFIESKHCRSILLELDKDEEFMIKK